MPRHTPRHSISSTFSASHAVQCTGHTSTYSALCRVFQLTAQSSSSSVYFEVLDSLRVLNVLQCTRHPSEYGLRMLQRPYLLGSLQGTQQQTSCSTVGSVPGVSCALGIGMMLLTSDGGCFPSLTVISRFSLLASHFTGQIGLIWISTLGGRREFGVRRWLNYQIHRPTQYTQARWTG